MPSASRRANKSSGVRGVDAMRRSLRRRSRAAQALGVTPGQVLANPLPRYDMDFPGCGCSSGVEHDLAKVGVEGSNPFARSKFSNTYLINEATPPRRGSNTEARLRRSGELSDSIAQLSQAAGLATGTRPH